jgi:hypothetical protein
MPNFINFPIGYNNRRLALQFDRNLGHHVRHGMYFSNNGTAGLDFSAGYRGLWVYPENGAEYAISDGHGARHALLFGVAGADAGYFRLTGNINDKASNTLITFGSNTRLRENEWSHIAWAYDGSSGIIVYINGVPAGYLAYTGTINTNSNAGIGMLYIGGSDHSNWHGRIMSGHFFENFALPYAQFQTPNHNTAFQPLIEPETFYVKPDGNPIDATFAFDYSTGSLADLSNGKSGRKFSGARNSSPQPFGSFMPIANNSGFVSRTSAESELPKFVASGFEIPTYAIVGSVPAGKTLYDDFQRTSPVNWAFKSKLDIGTARTGQNWQSVDAKKWFWGIQDGLFYAVGGGQDTIYVDSGTGSTNIDVTFVLRTGAFNKSGYGGSFSINFTDVNNRVRVVCYASGNCDAYTHIGGTQTLVQSAGGVPANFNTLRIVRNGNLLKVYVDNVEKISQTVTSLPSGQNVAYLPGGDCLLRLASVSASLP